MDVHEYLGVLRRGLVFIVLGVLLGVLVGGLLSSIQKPSYAAISRELVTSTTSATDTESRIASYVFVASSGLVLQPVIDRLDLDTTVDELSTQITVTAPPATFIIEITATAASAELARDLANAVSNEFRDVVSNRLESTGEPVAEGGASDPVRVVNIEEAALPPAPLPSTGVLFLIIGGVLGLAVGLVAASLRGAFDKRVRSPKDVAAVARIPILGDIPADRIAWTTPLLSRGGPEAPTAEAFRTLRAHIDHLRKRDGRHSFVFTAVGPGQGTTSVTANVAVALANTANSVVVVDADLRSSALSRLFGIHGALGLTEVLADGLDLDAALHSSDGDRLTVLPAGGRPSNPGELIASPRMRELVAELRTRFDVVLFDAPAISAVSDAAVLGSFDSSTLLVLADGTATRARLADALSLLAAGGSIPVGVVLNAIPSRRWFERAARRESAEKLATPVQQVVDPVAAEPLLAEPQPPEPQGVDSVVAQPVAAEHSPTDPQPADPQPAEPQRATTGQSLGTAKELDFAFAALPTATAAEQRAGDDPAAEHPLLGAVERPIVIKPDPQRPSSRFAPNPARPSLKASSAYAKAPGPSLPSESAAPREIAPAASSGTVVNTVSIRVLRDVSHSATVPPPIRRIFPRPTESTVPPQDDPPVRQAAFADGASDDATIETPSAETPSADTRATPVVGSLLSEIGGLPRVEVRTARQAQVTDASGNPERQARESYEQRARDLERAASERLLLEQQRLAVSIREQLAHDKRELESVLDNRLEDTVLRPLGRA